MPYYELSLEDLAKRTGDRRKMALQALMAGPKTPESLAKSWGVSTSGAYKVLERLRAKGSVERVGRGLEATYKVTDKGVGKLRWLIAKGSETAQEPTEDSQNDLGALYPDLGLSGGLVDGPVALQRVVEVDSDEFKASGIQALPSKVELEEDMIVAEPKYDGWLSQSAGGKTYSRRGKLLSGKFPPIDAEVSKLKTEHLIGELVYWHPDTRQMDEPTITSVAGTADLREASAKLHALERAGGFFQIVAFDLIAYNGQDISKQPFGERRELLESIVRTEDSRKQRITLSPIREFQYWPQVFKKSLEQGGEGVVLKNLRAPYFWRPLGDREPSPSGTQWKIKATRMDNFIAYNPHLSEKEKLLVTIGQYWKGELVDIGELDNFSKETEAEMLKRLKKGPVLIEVVFQERFPKPPGRLRNPRLRRFRDDVAPTPENASLPSQYAPD